MRHTNRSNILDQSDLVLERYGQGIKVVNVNSLPSVANSLDGFMQLPNCIYFLDADNTCVRVNETSASTCGWDSPMNAKGKSATDTFSQDIAHQVNQFHKKTMTSKCLQIVEEDIHRNDDVNFQCLTMNWPWYNEDNIISGIVGCSIVIGQQPLAKSMEQLIQMGLLNSEKALNKSSLLFSDNIFDGYYLSRRERECLQLCVRGKSAKEIARALGLSHRTIEHYIDNLKIKMNVDSKNALIDKVMLSFENNRLF